MTKFEFLGDLGLIKIRDCYQILIVSRKTQLYLDWELIKGADSSV